MAGPRFLSDGIIMKLGLFCRVWMICLCSWDKLYFLVFGIESAAFCRCVSNRERWCSILALASGAR